MSNQYYDFNDKWLFEGVWYDKNVAFKKNFLIKYYPSDNTLELYDTDCNRIFLKRTQMEELAKKDFFIGNTITVFGRHVKITNYVDCRTQKCVEPLREKTFALLLPYVIDRLGEIIHIIEENNFMITKFRMLKLTSEEALDFYSKVQNNHGLVFNATSGRSVALELVGEHAVQKFLDLLGPDDPNEARNVAPKTLRALYGIDKPRYGIHGSLSLADAREELQLFFYNQNHTPQPIVRLENTTCCLIKPHVIEAKNLGKVIDSINESDFDITGAFMLFLSKENAHEFLEIYNGVVSDYNTFLTSYLAGPCLALEIAGKEKDMKDVCCEFRKFAGPTDADMAKQIRPNSLRAKYGNDKYRNAIHCTDLPEDTNLELEYLFKMLKDV